MLDVYGYRSPVQAWRAPTGNWVGPLASQNRFPSLYEGEGFLSRSFTGCQAPGSGLGATLWAVDSTHMGARVSKLTA